MFTLEIQRADQPTQLREYWSASECTDAIIRIDAKFRTNNWQGEAIMKWIKEENELLIVTHKLNDNNRIIGEQLVDAPQVGVEVGPVPGVEIAKAKRSAGNSKIVPAEVGEPVQKSD